MIQLNPWITLFCAFSDQLLAAAGKATVVLILASLASWTLRRESAATRHLVWTAAVMATLAMPFISSIAPHWLTVPFSRDLLATLADPSVRPNLGASDASPNMSEKGRGLAPTQSATSSDAHSARIALTIPSADVDRAPISNQAETRLAAGAEQPASPTFSIVVVAIWLVGTAVLLLRLGVCAWLLRRSACGCRLVADRLVDAEGGADLIAGERQLLNAVDSIASRFGIRRPIQLLLGAESSMPMVWGAWRPTLRLPGESVDWRSEQQRSVILHELAHIRRLDLPILAVTQLACALYWFNPLIWLAAWRLQVERERACDDLVLAEGVRPSEYAEHLAQVVAQLWSPSWAGACALAMARPSSLESRIAAVLSPHANRRSLSRPLVWSIGLATATLTIPIAMLRATDAAPAQFGGRQIVEVATQPDRADTRNSVAPRSSNDGDADSPPLDRVSAPATSDATLSLSHLWDWERSAIAVQSENEVRFALVYLGFLSSGMTEWHSGNGREIHWGFDGHVYLVDAEKTRVAGMNVNKRVIAVKHTDDDPNKLFLDGKAFDLVATTPSTVTGDPVSPGRVFILVDDGEPIQTNCTMPLRESQDLVALGEFARQYLRETAAEDARESSEASSRPADEITIAKRLSEPVIDESSQSNQFRLVLTHEGDADKPFYNLTLSAQPPARQESPFSLYAAIDDEQVGRLVRYLTAVHYFETAQVTESQGNSSNGTRYVARVRLGDRHFEKSLGWDLGTVLWLNGLRRVVDGEPAKLVDQLLVRLDGQRKAWEQGETVNDLKTILSIERDAFTAGQPIPVKLELANVGTETRRFGMCSFILSGNEFTVYDELGCAVPFLGGGAGLIESPTDIKGGETRIIDSFDLSNYYYLRRPGLYTVCFRGVSLSPANVVQFQVTTADKDTDGDPVGRLLSLNSEQWFLIGSPNRRSVAPGANHGETPGWQVAFIDSKQGIKGSKAIVWIWLTDELVEAATPSADSHLPTWRHLGKVARWQVYFYASPEAIAIWPSVEKDVVAALEK